MQLFYSPTSPYARKCRVVARERGLMADIEETLCNPMEDPPELQSKNPLGKIPALILDDGTAIFDSPVIAEYLDGLGAAVRKLVAAVGWHGVAMFEFKLDDEGRYCLMEVNGRFWGSLQLAIDAGVDFPRLLWAMSQGRTSGPHELGYRVGLRERWWLGDLDHLYLRLRHDSGLRARWQALRVFLAGGGPQVINEVRRPDDAAPFWFELRSWLRRWSRSGLRSEQCSWLCSWLCSGPPYPLEYPPGEGPENLAQSA